MRFRLARRAVLTCALAAALGAGTARAATHVYATGYASAFVDEFTVGANGVLSPSFAHIAAGGNAPWYMAMTSNAKNLYVVTNSSARLEAFSVGPTGGLTHKSPSQGGALATGNGPQGLALSPDNKNAYVANYNFNSASTVSIYDIAADGSIKAHTPAAVNAGTGPSGVAVSRDGKSVYVASSDSYIYQFNRSANGSLTPKATPAVRTKPVDLVVEPDYMVLAPDGKHLYAGNYKYGGVGVFNVAPNGTLTEQQNSPVGDGTNFYVIAMSPNGKHVYAASNDDGMVYEYDVLAGGGLKQTGTVTAGTSLDGIWLTPSGKSAYATSEGTFGPGGNSGYDVAQFSIGATGQLTPKTPPTVPADNYPSGMVIPPNQSPKAAFTFSTVSGRKRRFDATGSKDADGIVKQYIWAFHDGSGTVVTGAKTTHTFTHAGTFNVTLTVVDNAGCSLARLWTGETAYCSGNPHASVVHAVTVK